MSKQQKLDTRLAALLLLFVAAGCRPTPPASRFYNGPTDPMRQVALPTSIGTTPRSPAFTPCWSFRATLIDKQHDNKVTTVSGDGSLLFRSPHSLLLRGTKDLAGEVFAIGSNDDEFWMKIAGDVDTTWWGHYANLCKPGCKPIPIAPNLLVEVLGVSLFDTDFTKASVPVMRFNNDDDSYMFTWNQLHGDHWIATKEIWYDRMTKLPKMVILYDPDGRAIVIAYLSKPVPLEVPDKPREEWPMVASMYQLQFPDDGTAIDFWFTDDYAVSHKGIPRANSFNRPDPDTKQVIQIDKDCAGAVE